MPMPMPSPSHRSIVVTSNRVVQDWGKYLGDNTMSTAVRIVDTDHSGRIDSTPLGN